MSDTERTAIHQDHAEIATSVSTRSKNSEVATASETAIKRLLIIGEGLWLEFTASWPFSAVSNAFFSDLGQQS
jgi:hypothetical protein